MNQNEAERIRRVYSQYDADAKTQRRWDPANPGNAANRAVLKQQIATILPDVRCLQILEIGCGTGDVLALLLELGAMEHQLTGIDLRESALEQARSRFPRAKFIPGNAEELPFPDGSFDVVAMFTVLSSVLAVDSRTAIAREAMRVLRPGGTVLCYDMRFRNPWNHHVRPVTRGKLRHLFPNVVLQLRSVTLLPQVARPLGSLVPCAFPALYAIPLLRTHWLGVLRKPATS